MVPEGWDILPLGEMAEFRNGLNFTKGDDGEPIKIVTIPDFWQRTEIRDMTGIKSITPKKKVPETSLLQSGDMLFVRSNGNPELVGRCLFFPEVDERISFSGFTIRGRVDQNHLVPEFAAYVMLTERTKAQFRRGRGGGNISNLSQDILAGVQVALPPLPEQRKIADILSTWDQAIEKTEALLANARTQKRALMQQLLTGKRRFPAFEGQPWKEVRLGDVSDIDANSLGSKTPANFEFDYIALSNVEPGQIVGPLETHIYAEAPSRARRKVSDGDLLVSTVRPNLMGFVRVTEAYAQCIASTGFAVVSPKASVSASYLFHYLFSHHMESQIHALVVGSNYPATNSSDVKKLKIKMPQFGEQVRIGEILDECDLESSRLNTNLTKLRTEKKALMQQLLTGKRRVVV